MVETIDLAEYLFKRLHQLGIRGIHGVPGDYNLTMLDYVEPAGLDWVGNCNELNAGYAADGYARIKGIGALVTAFGVGELSAINAVAGAYAEMAPVVHVVGTPATNNQDSGVCMHHSLGDGDFRIFADFSKRITVAQANLRDTATAGAEIDRCLRQCILQSRPVYLELPTDYVSAKISSAPLSQPLDLSIPSNDEGFEDAEVDLILDKIYAAKQPLIIVDGFTSRYGVSAEANELVRVTGFPTSTTPFGKGIIDESLPNFHGVYAGIAGKPVYTAWVESCDLVLRLGPLNSDVNTFGFTTIPDPAVTITFNRDSVSFSHPTTSPTTHYSNLHIKPLLQKLLARLSPAHLPKLDPYPSLGSPAQTLQSLGPPDPSAPIDQHTFYTRLSRFLRPHDILLTETGTPSIGGRDMALPPGSTLINSSLWLSIGYMLAAAQGAGLAQREGRAAGAVPASARTILLTGDGSVQMSVQAVSTMVRRRVDVVVLLLNNAGYTIERWIHGMHATYNDVAPWRYRDAARFFGAHHRVHPAAYPVRAFRAETWAQLDEVLADDRVRAGRGFTMIEVLMAPEDAPESLKKLVRTVQKRNSGLVEPEARSTVASIG